MTELLIQLLGKFQLIYQGQVVTTVTHPRQQSLLAYLALHRGEPQTRQRLAFLFWPDSSEAQAHTNLRKQLLHLRQTLPACDNFLVIDRRTVQFSPTAKIAVDVANFKAAIDEAATKEGTQAIGTLRKAIALYSGDLLPGCYDEWLLATRVALCEQYSQALIQLAESLESVRDYPAAVTIVQQLLRQDPLHESAYRHLMRLHALTNDRAAALRVYHTCVNQLRAELGVDPSVETQQLYQQLLNQSPALDIIPNAAPPIPFVGRQTEWQMLQHLWRHMLRDQAHFVLITGEAGIGKTRLAEEFLTWAQQQGIATAHTRSYAAEGRLAYAPIVAWLRNALLLAKLHRLDPVWLTEVGRLLPEIFATYPHVPKPDALTPSWQRNHLFEGLARAFLSMEHPLILLIDDLQWCDQDTLEWLHFFIRFAPQARLLLLGTQRSGENVVPALSQLLNNLRSSNRLTEFELSPLDQTETAKLIHALTTTSLEPQVLGALYAYTAGNPLFVVETIRSDQWPPPLADPLTTPPKQAPLALPAKVQAVIQQRLAQLSPAARQIAAIAALIGREFTFPLLSAISDSNSVDLISALDELWQRRMIRDTGAHTYDFTHDRLREVAGNELSPARRRYQHQRIAEALVTLFATTADAVAARLAFHSEQAGLIEQAIAYYDQAAQVALRLYSHHEAISHLEHKLLLLYTLPEARNRDEQEYATCLALNPPLLATKGYMNPQLLDLCRRAQGLEQKLGYPANPAILRVMAIAIMPRDFEQAHQIAQEILTLAHRQPSAPDRVLVVEGNYVIGVTAFWQGKFVDSARHLQQALDNYEPTQHIPFLTTYGADPGTMCMSRLSWTKWYLGYPDQARQLMTASLHHARELEHPFSLSYALTFATWLSKDLGDPDAALTHALDLVQHGQKFQFRSGTALGMTIKGWALVQNGDIPGGLAVIENGITLFQNINYKLWLPYAWAVWTEAQLQKQAWEAGLAAIADALQLSAAEHSPWYDAELYRLRGALLFAQKQDLAAAASAYQQAIVIARQQQAKSLHLRAVVSLARLWLQQGQHNAASQLLMSLYPSFTEGADTVDLRSAAMLCATLSPNLTRCYPSS